MSTSDARLGTLVVTGASRGIGAAIALLAAERGYAVAVNFGSAEEAARRVVGRIVQAGGRAEPIGADVAREDDVVRLFETAERRLGPIVGLVNNAGITGGSGRVEEIRADVLTRVLAVNVAGVFLCSREAIRRMSTRHGGAGGAIVNITSLAAQLGGGGEWVHYAASKGAVETFTVGVAREVARDGIRVNSVSPGLIDTDIHATSGVPDRLQRLVTGVPMGRAGTAQEVAEAAVWLLSPAASYVTGASITVGGGR